MALQTKALWMERLRKEKARLDVEGSPLPEVVSKAPKRLSVSYPFSTSPLLQEQVSLLHAQLRAARKPLCMLGTDGGHSCSAVPQPLGLCADGQGPGRPGLPGGQHCLRALVPCLLQPSVSRYPCSSAYL